MGLSAAEAKSAGKAGLPARRAALAILSDILTEKRPFDDALMEAQAGALAARDRAFVMALVQTSLRRKGECEASLAQFMSKPLPRKSGNASLILLMSAAQLLYLAAPPHAVIDLAVTLARADRDARHFSSLVNAVLRKVTAMKAIDDPELNVPPWLLKRWRRAYGDEGAKAIAQAHLDEPPLDLTIKADAPKWAQALGGNLVPTGTVRLKVRQGPIETLQGFAEGAWWVQDAAAALPVLLLGDVTAKSVLDLCAAPGGKTAQLVARGAKVTALDQSAPRMERVKRNLDRLGLEAELQVGDVLDYAEDKLFDAVLLDAPCSATGTIRRHPELGFIKSESQIIELALIQKRLLDHAAKFVTAGGNLLYCTCSLEPEEGENQIETFLQRHPDFVRTPLAPEDLAGERQLISANGDLRSLPFMNIGKDQGLDGFYAARLKRQ